MNKESFVLKIKEHMPAGFCTKGRYFKECFKLTEAECLETSKKVFQSCLQALEPHIPKDLPDDQTGRNWATKLGECTGSEFMKVQIKNKIDHVECNDLKNWKPKKS